MFGLGALFAAGFALRTEPDYIATAFALFACFLGLVFLWTGFSSPAKNYAETITIDKARSTIELQVSKQPARQIRAHLSELRGFYWFEGYAESFDRDVRSRRKEYLLYFVFRDQGSIYIARDYNSPGRLRALLSELQRYLGKELPELTEAQLWERPASERPSLELANPYPVSFFQKSLQDGKFFLHIAKAKMGLLQKALLYIVLLLFLSAPLIPASQILQAGGIASLLAGSFLFLFSIFWYGTILLVLFYYQRRVFFEKKAQGLSLKLRFPLFSFLDRDLEIPKEDVDFLAIHRSKGGHWLLCAHLKEPLPYGMGFLLSRSLGAERPAAAYNSGNAMRLLPLARAAGWTKPGHGALLEDLLALKEGLGRS